jgi:hypothetical protein
MAYPLPRPERTPSGKICAYCGHRNLTGRERPEHPLPAAIGSSFIVDTVCDPCNEWAGVNVDQPFLAEDWLRIVWAEHNLRIPRRRGRGRVVSPLRRGFTSEGVRVTVDEQWKPHLGSLIKEDPETGEVRILAGSEEEAERMLQRVRDRAAVEGKEARIQQWSATAVRPSVQIDINVDMTIWRRMAAKIALGCGSVAYPEAWRLSEPAHELRRHLREDVRNEEGQPIGTLAERIDGTHVLRRLVEPPEHLICFLPGEPVRLAVVLFGQLLFGTEAIAAGYPRPALAWRLDPRTPSASVETSFDGLMFRPFEQVGDESADATSGPAVDEGADDN